MKKLSKFLGYLLFLGAVVGATFNLEARCKVPNEGPPGPPGEQGPPGPPGPPGPEGLLSYSYAFNTIPFPLDPVSTINIPFAESPILENIIHIPGTPNFIVQNSGIYLIEWSLIAEITDDEGELLLTVNLVDAANTPFSPSPQALQTLEGVVGFTESLSGHLLVSLTAGDTIQLRVEGDTNMSINSPTLSILQIAPL